MANTVSSSKGMNALPIIAFLMTIGMAAVIWMGWI